MSDERTRGIMCPFCNAYGVPWLTFPQSETPWHVAFEHVENCPFIGLDSRCYATEDELRESWSTDLETTFDLRWEADMRAVRRWREANPGNELVLPDHADLIVWLLEQHETAREDGRQQEREACAKLCSEHADQCDDTAIGRRLNSLASDIAAAIRALGDQ